MRLAFSFRSAVLAAIASAAMVFAGSYPPGTLNQSFDAADGAVDLGDGSIIGSDGKAADGGPVAATFATALRLADKDSTNTVGSFKLPDLDPGNVIRAFDVKASVVMNAPAAGTNWGEGWSLNFGRIPADNGTGEGGFAPLLGGLTIAFDPTKNTDDDATSIEVFVGGVSITNILRTFSFDAIPRSLIVHWDNFGLDITFEGRVVCTDVQTPGFSPQQGNTFAFTARTTQNTMDLFLDTMKITTQPLPVLETGGPIISEFVANNGDFEDEFAEKPGWLEILNGSSNTVNLANWYLTDSKQNLTKWKIGNMQITPYNYQVIFASGRDRQLTPISYPHANFSIAKSGGYIALVRPDGTNIASSYEYGQQEKNVAYGEKGTNRVRGYMYPSTPGALNTVDPAPASIGPDVSFSHAGGFVLEPVTLVLGASTNLPGAEIRYTLDRTEPGTNSPIYTNALTITNFTLVRARVLSPGHLPGRVASRGFVFPDATLTNFATTGKVFDSNLPLIYLDTYGVNVDGSSGGSRPWRPTFAMVIPPDPKTGRASLLSTPEYMGPAGTHVRGESSAGFGQLSYALEIDDEAGKDTDVSLLGMPADSDWALYGPWSEKTIMRNKLIFDWTRAMRGPDGMAVRTRFVEVFYNQSKTATGQVGYSTYRGIYVLMEKLKRGNNRLDIANLNDKTVDPELITGGYIFRHDKDDALKVNWTTSSGVTMQSFDPDRINTVQSNYLKGYINNFEKALNASTYKNRTNGFMAYIDPDTWIDAQWMLEVAKQVDGYVFSTYFHKDRAGRFCAGPLWDFNIALGNANYADAETPTSWYQNTANGVGQLWYPRMHSDADYHQAHWDRYWQMRRSILETNAVNAAINANAALLLDGATIGVSNRAPAEIQNPAARHYRKYPRLGQYDWPNPAAETKMKTYQDEVEYMRTWLHTRLNWIDDQSMKVGKVAVRPPLFSNNGGWITNAVELSMTQYTRVDTATTFATGSLYYTTDNSDPRLQGGAMNPSAAKYTAPLTIDRSVTVNARILATNNVWSPLTSATFYYDAVPASASNLVVSEVMYRPANLSTGEVAAVLVDPNGFEYIELRNVGRKAVDLSGVKFTKGVDFDFNYTPSGARLLKPGESVVLVADKRAFGVRYPFVPAHKIVGQFHGHLDSGGETVEIEAADGSTIKQFKYDNSTPWPPAGDGNGRSLILKDPAANPNPDDAAGWAASASIGGTPGQSGLGADTFSGDPLKDSDGDGLPDFLEFAAGTDAENPGSVFFPKAAIASFTVNGVDGKYITYGFQHRADPKGVQFAVESSRDLKTWTAADAELASLGTATNLDGTVTESYRGATPILANPKQATFYRLRVRSQ